MLLIESCVVLRVPVLLVVSATVRLPSTNRYDTLWLHIPQGQTSEPGLDLYNELVSKYYQADTEVETWKYVGA